ncbi:MAG: DUF4248 domain-containing protein [Tannerellaceae bacterium]|nr:DUF4248 domain-containing protein [Tannerellaceae bacterium]
MKKFIIRPYRIQELGLHYFPYSTPNSASQQLMRWVYYNPYLMKDLEKTSYRVGQRILTPRQVSLIIEHLGEPGT